MPSLKTPLNLFKSIVTRSQKTTKGKANSETSEIQERSSIDQKIDREVKTTLNKSNKAISGFTFVKKINTR